MDHFHRPRRHPLGNQDPLTLPQTESPMKRLLSIILLAAALAAAPAAGQTVKSLGYNTTNGFVTYSGSNSLTFTNALQFSTNARAATRTNLELGGTWLTNTNVTNFRTAIGLGATNDVTFSNITASGNIYAKDSTASPATNSTLARGIQWTNLGGSGVAAIYGSYPGVPQIYLAVGATNALTDVATFRATGMTVNSNAVVGGTLAVTGNVTLSGVNNTMPGATTADSASSLMTRGLSDVRYLGEMWHAWRMSAYNTTNIPVSVFKTAPCVLFTNGQTQFFSEAFLDPSKYAGKTVRVLAYCRVDSTNGGNVQGAGRITYLTNNAGGPDSNFPITVGGQAHGVIGVFTNVSTDVFPVATSTNQYLIFTSNVGTIPTNATLMIASFGFNRASTNTTFTNGNLFMQAVEVVVE